MKMNILNHSLTSYRLNAIDNINPLQLENINENDLFDEAL